jgi:hypothetical protein
MGLAGKGRGLPSPLRRLARDRLSVSVLVILTALALAAAHTSASASVSLTGAVDRNWRGAYDLLIRPRGAVLPLEQTKGLVEPNFLSYAGHGGISSEQLAEIRGLPGVELAAPVSVAGYMSYTLSRPTIFTDTLPSKPTLFELRFRLVTNDGVHDVVLQEQTATALVDATDSSTNFKSIGMSFGESTYPSGRVTWDGSFTGDLPAIRSPLIAVDPGAERALLGPSATFLDRFALIQNRSSLTAGSVDPSLIPPEFALSHAQFAQGDEYDPKSPVVPVVTNDGLLAALTLEFTVTQVGHPIAAIPEGDKGPALHEAERQAGSTRVEVGTTSKDLSQVLRPFEPADYTVLWPGSGPAEGGAFTNSLPGAYDTMLVGRPTYTSIENRQGSLAPAFRVTPLGPVGLDGSPLSGDARGHGAEPGYRPVTVLPLPVANGFLSQTPYDQPFHFAPIGSFDLAAVKLPDNALNYVPLGAYDPPKTELVAGPDGGPLVSPLALRPTLNPAGFIDVPPLAVTDLQGAELLRGPAPIDAIRVRVAGLAAFTDSSRQKVELVAAQIRRLGLDVQIVAGSSPQAIELFVPSYFVEKTPAADLGYVAQEWTTLGAAQRVEVGLAAMDQILLIAAVLTGLALAIAMEATRLASRAREVAVKRAAGWSRRSIWLWNLEESIVLGALVGVAGVIAWRVSGGAAQSLLAGLSLASILPVTAAVAGRLALRAGDPNARQRGDLWLGVPKSGVLAVRGPASLGVRTAFARPGRTAVLTVSWGVAAAGAAIGILVVASVLARVGSTRLAVALTLELQPVQLAMLLLTVGCSVAATVLILRVDMVDRRRELRSLVAAGWSRQQVTRSLLAQLAFIGVGAASLAALAAAGAGAALTLDSFQAAALATTMGFAIAAVAPILRPSRVA